MTSAAAILLNLSHRAADAGKSAITTIKGFPAHNKIGLGLGITSLGLGAMNFKANQSRVDLDQKRIELDHESLSALQKIHKALAKKPTIVVIKEQ